MIGILYIVLSLVLFFSSIKMIVNKIFILHIGFVSGILFIFGGCLLYNQYCNYDYFDPNYLLVFNLFFIFMLINNFFIFLKIILSKKRFILNTSDGEKEKNVVWFQNTTDQMILPNQILLLNDGDREDFLNNIMNNDYLVKNKSMNFFECVTINNKFNIIRIFKREIYDEKNKKVLGIIGIAENLTELYDIDTQKEIQKFIKNSDYNRARELLYKKIDSRICWSFE